MPPRTPKGDHAVNRFLPAALLIASLLWCVYWLIHAQGYWEDDAWIHLEFARSVSQGHGFAFNGRVVAGDTAPLWVLLLAGVHALIPQWVTAGKLLTILGAALGLSAVYAFARRMAQHLLAGRAAQLFPAAMLLLVVVNPYTCYWIFSGMAPLAASGVACWAILMATTKRPTRFSFLLACLLAGLGPLLRPEMFFLALLLALPLYGQWRRLAAPPVAKLLCLTVGLALIAGPLLTWSCYSWYAFGQLLPNTNAAKRAGPNESVLYRLINVYAAGLPVILCGTVAGLLHLALHPSAALRSLHTAIRSALAMPGKKQRPTAIDAATSPMLPLEGWLFIFWAMIASCFYLANHTYVQTRYVFISAPGLSIVVLALALYLWPRWGQWMYVAAIAAGAAVSIAITIPLLRNKAAVCDATRQIATFMMARIPPDAPVAVYPIGQIAFQSHHPLIDTGGITQPGAIPYLYASSGAMTHWARSEGAQYSIEAMPPVPGSIPVFTTQVPYVGWTFHTSRYAASFPVSVWKFPAATLPEELSAKSAATLQ